MDEAAAIVARCERLISDIALPDPFDLDTLCNRLGAMWGSTVCLYPMRLPPGGPCGMWASIRLGRQVFDLFAIEANASLWHQATIFFHEVGHRLLGHAGASELTVDMKTLLASMMPTLDPKLIDRTFGCGREPTSYDDPNEKEAEYIGRSLLDKAIGWRAGPLGTDAPPGIVRLHTALDATTRGSDG